MRRLISCLFAGWMAILPALGQSDDSLRMRRNPQPVTSPSGWAESFETPPAAPPAGDAVLPGTAGFALDINVPPHPANLPTTPRLPAIAPFVVPYAQRAVDRFVKKLGARELNLLSTRDVVILIDKSGSMGDKDCPPPAKGLRFIPRGNDSEDAVSRWDWCEGELFDLSQSAAGALRQGLRVVMFASDQQVYDHVRVNQIPQIFHTNYPEGSTNAAPALRAQIDQYFGNKSTGRSRPMVIAVITDGLPSNTKALKKVIIDATTAMQRPDEIAITFLQVGTDKKGIHLVHELDDDLPRQGASFDIVDCKDFPDLLNQGLGRALADAISENGKVAGR